MPKNQPNITSTPETLGKAASQQPNKQHTTLNLPILIGSISLVTFIIFGVFELILNAFFPDPAAFLPLLLNVIFASLFLPLSGFFIFRLVNLQQQTNTELLSRYQNTYNELQKTRSELEKKVDERTTQLAHAIFQLEQANQQLKIEMALTRQQKEEVEALREATSKLSNTLELKEVLDSLLSNLKKVVWYESAVVFLLEKDELRAMAWHGLSEKQQLMLKTFPFNGGLFRAFADVPDPRKALVLEDATQSPYFENWENSDRIHSWIGAPLYARDNLIGYLTMDHHQIGLYDTHQAALAESFASQAAMAIDNARLYRDLEQAYMQTVLALAKVTDARDTYTNEHSHRMMNWAELLARELGCSKSEVEAVKWGALLHDIGKIGIPDEILRKPVALTDSEWSVMKRHPQIGAEIIAPLRNLVNVAEVIFHHHERYDGSGYPNGLTGAQIPLGARILAVVDAFIAMTDERVYRRAMSSSQALTELEHCAGSQFDPQIVRCFVRLYTIKGEG
jgi:putative nucleotidyltransferase with HDIG domain